MDLRPWNLGVYQGKITNEVLPEIKKYIEDETKVPKGGESFKDFRLRCLLVVTALAKEVLREKSDILCSSHYRDLKIVEAWIKNGLPKDLSIDIPTMMTDTFKTGEVLPFPLSKFQS